MEFYFLNYAINITIVILVIDNASFHISKEVEAFFNEISDIVNIIHLPPYSPDLNPVENCWKVFKQKLANKLFKTKTEFFDSIINALNSLTLDINIVHYFH